MNRLYVIHVERPLRVNGRLLEGQMETLQRWVSADDARYAARLGHSTHHEEAVKAVVIQATGEHVPAECWR